MKNLRNKNHPPNADLVQLYLESSWDIVKAVYDAIINGTIGKDPENKAYVIENPSGSEDLPFFFTDVAITVSKIRAILVGSATPSVTWTLRHATSRSATGAELVTGGTVTTEVDTGVDITVFDDATISADSHVWIETTNKSGTVDSINITLFYDED